MAIKSRRLAFRMWANRLCSKVVHAEELPRAKVIADEHLARLMRVIHAEELPAPIKDSYRTNQ